MTLPQSTDPEGQVNEKGAWYMYSWRTVEWLTPGWRVNRSEACVMRELLACL